MTKKNVISVLLLLVSSFSVAQEGEGLVYLFDELDAIRPVQAIEYCQRDEAKKMSEVSKNKCEKTFAKLHQRCTWLDLVEHQKGRRVSFGDEWKKIMVEPAQVQQVAKMIENCVLAEHERELTLQP